MNRRSFLQQMLLGGAAFNILPGAGRVWKAVKNVEPFWQFTFRYRMTRDGVVRELDPVIREWMICRAGDVCGARSSEFERRYKLKAAEIGLPNPQMVLETMTVSPFPFKSTKFVLQPKIDEVAQS